MLRDTYAEINLEALKHNILLLKKAAGVPLMAVVKADAYGHGAPEISRAAWDVGTKWFAVSNPDEATEIREQLPDAHILVLSSVMEKACVMMVKEGISVSAYKPEHIYKMEEAAKNIGKRAKIHLKADTGMGRIGFRTENELCAVLDAADKCPNVEVEGLFTHFATADEADLSLAKKQLTEFMNIKNIVLTRGFHPICHASNSAGIITLADAHLDMCRAGISMYGYPPSGEVDMSGISLKPVMSFISYVSFVKRIKRGESVSYGRKFIAEDDRVIATVSSGYADGYLRALSGKAQAYIKGGRVRQVGRVCMDQIMFDVTGRDIREGDKIELFGTHVGADELAELAGTISYELLTGITKRVPRVYV